MRGSPLAAALVILAAAARPASSQPGTHHHSAQGWLGDYDMAREGSGTSWQPEAAGMEGLHFAMGPWRAMAHGFAFGIYAHQGGPRGDNQAFSTNMAMLASGRALAGGTLAVRGMISLEPLMGRTGYVHLLQTGESADGINHLIDRQHPLRALSGPSRTGSWPRRGCAEEGRQVGHVRDCAEDRSS